MLHAVALTGAVAATALQLLTIAVVPAATSRWILNIRHHRRSLPGGDPGRALGAGPGGHDLLSGRALGLLHAGGLDGRGVGAPSLAGQLVVVVLAGLLLGWRGSLVAVAVSVATVFGMAYAQSAGRVPLPSVVYTPYSRALVIASYAIIVGLIAAQIRLCCSRLSQRLERQLVKTSLLLDTAEGLAPWTELTRVLDAICDSVLGATRHTRVGNRALRRQAARDDRRRVSWQEAVRDRRRLFLRVTVGCAQNRRSRPRAPRRLTRAPWCRSCSARGSSA